MPIVPALCTQCGGQVQVNNAQDAAICPYCQTPFIVEKAIQRYNITHNHNYHINNNYVNINAGPSIEELYWNARTLIIGGACVEQFVDDSRRTQNDLALQAIYIKMLSIAPSDDRMLILRAANAIAISLRSFVGIEQEDINKYLHLINQNDHEFYITLLNMVNKRKSKLTNFNGRYSGGLLRMKLGCVNTREDIDRCFAPDEGMDLPFLIDYYYCEFWKHTKNNEPMHDYLCQRIYALLPPNWQQWFAQEFQRRCQVEREIVDALSCGNYRRAYDAISSASQIYPSLNSLLKDFYKTTFSYRCTLSMDPSTRSIDKYGPDLVHNALRDCPSTVAQIKNL